MAEYLEALEAHSEAHNPEKKSKPASAGLMRFVKAHKGGGGKAARGGNVAKGEGA